MQREGERESKHIQYIKIKTKIKVSAKVWHNPLIYMDSATVDSTIQDSMAQSINIYEESCVKKRQNKKKQTSLRVKPISNADMKQKLHTGITSDT